MDFTILSTKLPGLSHGKISDHNYFATLDLDKAIDRNIPKTLATELGDFKNKI